MDIMCETKHRSNARNLTLSSDSQLTWYINYGWITSEFLFSNITSKMLSLIISKYLRFLTAIWYFK